MVWTFEGNNFNRIYKNIFETVKNEGTRCSPRGRATLELNPAITKIYNPQMRLCSARQGFSTPFSVAEVIWFMAGRADGEFIEHYLKSFEQFRDKPYKNHHGGYGMRLRKWGIDPWDKKSLCCVDQLTEVYYKLKEDRDSRRAVCTLWNPIFDNNRRTLDNPCNIASMFKIRDGKLNLTQCIRSNDVILGIPQNCFQFSLIQEIMAGWLEVDIGHLVLFSDSLHLYENDFYNLENVKITDFDIYRYYTPKSAKMRFEDFQRALKQILRIERSWRSGSCLQNLPFVKNDYWLNCSRVLLIFNLFKQKEENHKIFKVWKNINNEFQWSMARWIYKRTKSEEIREDMNWYLPEGCKIPSVVKKVES